jgi:hypothetical protein
LRPGGPAWWGQRVLQASWGVSVVLCGGLGGKTVIGPVLNSLHSPE